MTKIPQTSVDATEPATTPAIGLALGGGAARGLSHIPMLEAFDELGIRPKVIAGTSIGAIIGSAYASGMSALDIREHTLSLLSRRTDLLRRLVGRWPDSLTSLWSPFSLSVLNAEAFFDIVMPERLATDFSELFIPLKIVAADLLTHNQVIIETGRILPAVGASSAIPALFKPVLIGEHVLIDGGVVNPTPFDILGPEVNLTVAVDVSGVPTRIEKGVPSTLDTIVLAAQITLKTIAEEKMQHKRPDILIRPNVTNFGPLEFFKVKEILAASLPAKDELKRSLEVILETHRRTA